MAKRLTVIKCDAQGAEVFRWQGAELRRSDTEVILEARFNIEEHPLGGITLRAGDRMVETYSSRLWYNIFEVHDGESGALKCWYCNLSHPAELGEDEIRFRDLALDLIVHPDGRQQLLDEDEFAELDLPEDVRQQALEAWEELQEKFRTLLETG
jgi:protein associated with RNAse G/E